MSAPPPSPFTNLPDRRPLLTQDSSASAELALRRVCGINYEAIADDFSDLLCAIRGNAELALGNLPTNSPLRTPLEEIERAGRAATDLSRRLRAQAERSSSALERVHVSRLVTGLSTLLRSAAGGPPVLRYERATDPRAEPWVEVDCATLRQVVAELILAATWRARESPATAVIRAGVRQLDAQAQCSGFWTRRTRPDHCVCIEIVGHGRGAASAEQQSVGEPGSTAAPDHHDFELSSLRSAVGASGGSIQVLHTPEGGSRAQLRLPLAEAPASDPSPALAVAANMARADSPARAQGLVLVAEPDPSVRKITTALLTRSGFSVVATASGYQAIEALWKYDDEVLAVMLDLNGSEPGAAQTFCDLRRVRPGVPLVLCGSRGDALAGPLSTPRDGVAFAHKPFRRNELAQTLAEVCGSSQRHSGHRS